MKIAVAILLLCLTLPSSASAAGNPVNLRSYVNAVHELRIELDGVAKSRPASAAAARRVQAGLRAIPVVRIVGGAVIATDMRSLAGEIDPTSGASVRSAAAKLDVLDDELQTESPTTAPNAALAALSNVYANPVFHPTCSGLGCVGVWIGNHFGGQIAGFLEWLRNATNLDLSPAITLASALLVALGVAAVAFLYVRGTLKRVTVIRNARVDEETGLTESEARATARRAASAGDARMAFRYLFLSVMLDLQDRGLIALRPGWTNRDHLTALRNAGLPLTGPLGELVDAFDRVWYGHASIDEMELRRLQDVASEITTRSIAAA
jgi:Domain of unknown function (DUF4129)